MNNKGMDTPSHIAQTVKTLNDDLMPVMKATMIGGRVGMVCASDITLVTDLTGALGIRLFIFFSGLSESVVHRFIQKWNQV